jgi:hypothetical protein
LKRLGKDERGHGEDRDAATSVPFKLLGLVARMLSTFISLGRDFARAFKESILHQDHREDDREHAGENPDSLHQLIRR